MKGKIITLIIWLALLVFVISYMVYDAVANGNIPEEHEILKCICTIAVGTVGMIRIFKGHRSARKPLSFYEKHFEKNIAGAFREDRSARKQLLECCRRYDEDRNKDAIKKLDALMKKCMSHKDKEVVCLITALCYDDIKMTDKAIEAYNNTLRHNPLNSSALSNLGLIYTNLNEFKIAIEYYEAAINADPSNPFAYNNLGSLYYRAGDYDRAEELLLRALELMPTMYQAANSLALIYAMKRDDVKSRKYFNISVSNGGDAKSLKNAISNISCDLTVIDELVRRWQRITEKESACFKLGAKEGKSVVGGKLNERAPVDENGRPMRLLAAIFLSEMPHIEDFPAKGVLRFYIAENDAYGADFSDPISQKGFRVMYDEDESRFESSANNVNSEFFPVMGSFRISFRKEKEAMPFDVYGAQDLFEENFGEIRDGIFDALYDSLAADQSKVGGYPYFTQYDPREDKYEQYDTLLFQLNSTTVNGRDLVMFGDCGVCNFFISREALRRRDFSDVLYTWDCT